VTEGQDDEHFDAGHGMIEIGATRYLRVGSAEYEAKRDRDRAHDRWKDYFPDKDWLIEQVAREPLDKLFVPWKDWGWFLQQMLSYRSLLENAIESGATVDAVMYAAELSTVTTEFRIKFKCEAAWDTGVRQRETLDGHRDKAIVAKQVAAEENRRQWQAEADLIWQSNPDHSCNRVGQLIAAKLRKNGIVAKSDTIRRAIKKVGITG
jgi:hypothetical protein